LEETQTADSAIGLCAVGSPCDNFQQQKRASRVMRRFAERNDHAVKEAKKPLSQRMARFIDGHQKQG